MYSWGSSGELLGITRTHFPPCIRPSSHGCSYVHLQALFWYLQCIRFNTSPSGLYQMPQPILYCDGSHPYSRSSWAPSPRFPHTRLLAKRLAGKLAFLLALFVPGKRMKITERPQLKLQRGHGSVTLSFLHDYSVRLYSSIETSTRVSSEQTACPPHER